MGQLLHHLLNPGNSNVYAGHRGAHAAVAFVLHQAKGTGFSHHDVHAGYPDIGRGKFITQYFAANLDKLIHRISVIHAGDTLGKELGNFNLGLMNRRHDDMRWLFIGQLDDVLTHIGFHRLNSHRLQRMVKLNLFAHHRLAFDHCTGVMCFGNINKYPVRLFRSFCPVHLDPVSCQFFFQRFQQLR